MTSNALDSSGNFDRRSKTFRDLLSLTPTYDRSIQDDINGDVYEYDLEPQCKVCSLPYELRARVDRLLVSGRTYQKVFEDIAPRCAESDEVEEDEVPSYWSIRGHQKKHLDYDQRAIREVVERRARQRGLDILEGTRTLITSAAIHEIIVNKGFNKLTEEYDGDGNGYYIGLEDLIRSSSMLDAIEQSQEVDTNTEVLMAQFNAILEAVRAEVPEELWSRIVGRLQEIDPDKQG